MKITIERIVGWDRVLNSARTTAGKKELDKEPSDTFKKQLLISEHSPIRNLLYEITIEELPYWTAMHLRTHHMGFKSAEDDLFFIQTQRTDRTQKERDKIYQDAPVRLKIQANAQSLINVSRVRLCHKAMKETRETWEAVIEEVSKIEPFLAEVCVPNCLYRGFFPEQPTCGYVKTKKFMKIIQKYHESVPASNLQEWKFT